jgi:hypothetical protein
MAPTGVELLEEEVEVSAVELVAVLPVGVGDES